MDLSRWHCSMRLLTPLPKEMLRAAGRHVLKWCLDRASCNLPCFSCCSASVSCLERMASAALAFLASAAAAFSAARAACTSAAMAASCCCTAALSFCNSAFAAMTTQIPQTAIMQSVAPSRQQCIHLCLHLSVCSAVLGALKRNNKRSSEDTCATA